MRNISKNNQKGFTLVELAIVLVIIGLIVSGVLAGRDLIMAHNLLHFRGHGCRCFDGSATVTTARKQLR